MKITARGFLLFGFMVFLTCASCKNINSAGGGVTNKKVLLPGKWKIVKITTEPTDNSATGPLVDENNLVITLNADGTGSSAAASGGSAFKWAMAGNDTYINITDSATGQASSLELTKISGSAFTVKDTSTHPAQWETFNKLNVK